MGDIGKLIIEPKKHTRADGSRLESAIIDDGTRKKYVARGFVRINGKRQTWSHECDTIPQGIRLINELAEEFPHECAILIALWGKAFGEWDVMEWQEESR